MPHHSTLFFSSLADASLSNLTPVADGILRKESNDFISNHNFDIVAAMLGGASMDYGYIDSPSLRCVANPYLFPFNENATIPTDPNFVDWSSQPVRIPPRQPFGVKAFQDSAGASDSYCILHGQRGFRPTPSGPRTTLRGTGTTTVSANGWSQVEITWSEQLPAGRYAVIGMSYLSATALVARIISDDCIERPGCFGQVDETSRGPQLFRNGNLGEWCQFENDILPEIEAYCDAADTSQEVYLDLVQISSRN